MQYLRHTKELKKAMNYLKKKKKRSSYELQVILFCDLQRFFVHIQPPLVLAVMPFLSYVIPNIKITLNESDHKKYIIKNWFDGNECNVKSIDELSASVAALAKLNNNLSASNIFLEMQIMPLAIANLLL